MATAAELIAQRRAARQGGSAIGTRSAAAARPQGDAAAAATAGPVDPAPADQSTENPPPGPGPAGETTDDADSRLDAQLPVERGDDGGEAQRLG